MLASVRISGRSSPGGLVLRQERTPYHYETLHSSVAGRWQPMLTQVRTLVPSSGSRRGTGTNGVCSCCNARSSEQMEKRGHGTGAASPCSSSAPFQRHSMLGSAPHASPHATAGNTARGHRWDEPAAERAVVTALPSSSLGTGDIWLNSTSIKQSAPAPSPSSCTVAAPQRGRVNR